MASLLWQDEEKFRRNRELELKHGRICISTKITIFQCEVFALSFRCSRNLTFVGVLGMVAAIGMIVPDLFGRFGGYLSPSMDLMLECFLFIFPHVSSIFSLNSHSLLYHGCDGCSLRKFSDVPCTIEVGEPCLVDVCWRDSISPVTWGHLQGANGRMAPDLCPCRGHWGAKMCVCLHEWQDASEKWKGELVKQWILPLG